MKVTIETTEVEAKKIVLAIDENKELKISMKALIVELEKEKERLLNGVYANLEWFNNKLNVNELLNYKIWLAQWTNANTHSAKFKVDLWQYADNGNCAFAAHPCLACAFKPASAEEITGRAYRKRTLRYPPPRAALMAPTKYSLIVKLKTYLKVLQEF